MRICLISSSFYPAISYGGPIAATWSLSKELARKDVEMYVSTTNANGRSRLDVDTSSFVKKDENLFVRYYHEQIINKFSIDFIFGVWSDIKKGDVIYIQYLFHYTVFFGLLFSLLHRKKVVLSARGSLSSWGLNYKHRWKKKIWLTCFISPFIKNIIWQASSYVEVNDIKSRFKNAYVLVVNDGVDFKSFQNIKSLSVCELVNRFTESQFKVVSEVFFSMGRLHEIKAFDIMIDAFYLFLQKNPDAKLLIAGPDDGFRGVLMKKIIEYDLLESVFLIGSVEHEDKCLLLSNSSAFVLPSHFESFGIVVVEALASGLPVIVSNNTPWRDIEKNKFGIFTPNNKHSLFNAFCKIKEQEFNSNRLKEFAKLNFDWRILANRFKEIIQE